MAKRWRIQGESFFNFLLAVLGFLIVFLSVKLGFGTLKKPGPGLFSFLCGLVIFLQSLVLFFFGKRVEEREDSSGHTGVKKGFLILATFLFWIILMPYVGYVLITFFATLSFSKVMGLEGWRKPVALSIGITVFCYLLFDVYLYTDLPRGLLG
jgi:putative tricarboxylic transport membrane protein